MKNETWCENHADGWTSPSQLGFKSARPPSRQKRKKKISTCFFAVVCLSVSCFKEGWSFCFFIGSLVLSWQHLKTPISPHIPTLIHPTQAMGRP
ncbi:hypothetical protein DM01DRAFT_1239484 [Hesseltinella vesiculosa]|uniref:Uncharacterized protein n=1 Tax=Hesseltinella vesiculosa TaxID=101127 RepID=A0A1X2GM89_9FUNG|nr:hypothetical protein DM01DRAFT_1239484 [Hesseltinella vesiculosa]